MSNQPSHWLGAAESALRAAPPTSLLFTARSLLADYLDARSVTLLLADYGLTVLQPVTRLPHTGETVPARGDHPAGRAFSAQAAVVEVTSEPGMVTAHLPVTVRGDRLGVLSVHLPEPSAGAPRVLELAAFATAVGHEMLTAERDTDLYLQARRRKRLTLAAEMQWQLLPGRGFMCDEYTLGAHLEPAYAIGGDNFDWSTTEDHLTITVSDGSGHGIQAALLTNLTVNALRNARRSGISPADQACLADQAVYGEYGGSRYSATLLLRFDLSTGRIQAVDAGSPQLYRLRDDIVERVELEAQMPLGMFEESEYHEQPLQVEPGDRLIIASSGVHGALSADGKFFGEIALRETIAATRSSSAHEAARAVVDGLIQYHGSHDLPHDAAVVCLDWRGRPAAP
ncbi:phosphatase [Streptomyces agglomeratus]|uniref:PP2C family protein-serine/threonine phosphatase n=1 Tax=Streptomyces agglomeratus TaxID=285458 RepID=UPI0008544BBF|nr:PP2C family protein-serine/threonine phosphatase [Streptomyces agglomeratus]OEJ37721.1 phosphatase [Streptomyces agglomeratus]OEJ47892.1 phosphatase [Streptomyces agglomeratus]